MSLDWRGVLSGNQRGLVAGTVRGVLSAVAPVYAGAIGLRSLAYQTGWKQVQRVGVPVISVGNLTTGGTGKTPVVAWIVQRLTDMGLKPGILSRGYGRLDSGMNDEQLVLDQLCPGVPHGQHPDRVSAARRAIDQQGCNVLVLDDGFQHRRLGRDLDIVLIDALCPWGYGSVLPRGLLREPVRSLSRADVVAITRCDQIGADERESIQQVIRKHTGTAAAEITFRPTGLVSNQGQRRSLADLQRVNLGACCGIGNPQAFLRTLTALGTPPTADRFRVYPDHHHYTAADLSNLADWVRVNGIETVVVTQKDLVKLPGTHLGRASLWALEIGVEFRSGQADFEQRLRQVAVSREIIGHK